MDRTLILVKPDAFARGLTGEIIARFERKGLRIVALEQRTLDEAIAKQHYAEHEGKAFFGELVEFITSGPLVAMVLEGYVAVIEDDGQPRTGTAVTEVTFRELDDAWLEWYVGTGEWQGRAGAYAVQGAGQALVTRIDGEHSNVVGLPVGLLLALLPEVL